METYLHKTRDLFGTDLDKIKLVWDSLPTHLDKTTVRVCNEYDQTSPRNSFRLIDVEFGKNGTRSEEVRLEQ